MFKWSKLILASALALTLAACGADQSGSPSESSAATERSENAIVITDVLGNEHVFETPPESVAALSYGEMDILLKLGANVVGRPTISGTMTAEEEAIKEIGNPHEPSFEQIAVIHPDVLIVPPSFMQFASNIEAQGTKVIYSSANSVQEIKDSMEMFGELFQKQEEAAKLVEDIDTRIAALEKAAEQTDTLLIYGAPGTYMVALDSSLSGDILNLAGGKNVASDFPATDLYPTYASLSVEKIVERNPKVVMVLTHSNPDAVVAGFNQQMNTSAAWKNLDAVKNDNIIILPADLFGNNPGTKVIESIEFMVKTLNEVNK